jgi:GGDEF domain-containing protein
MPSLPVAIPLHCAGRVATVNAATVGPISKAHGHEASEEFAVSVMSTVLGSLTPDLTRGSRDRQDVSAAKDSAAPIALRSSDSVVLPDGLGPVYNEEAFRYFLQIERKRASRSNSRFLLLLVDLKQRQGTPFDASSGRTLFSAMWSCLRETDFIGWYRQGRVASAVLTQVGETPGVEVAKLVADRVRTALTQSLSGALAARIQVRVYQVPVLMNGRSGE